MELHEEEVVQMLYEDCDAKEYISSDIASSNITAFQCDSVRK